MVALKMSMTGYTHAKILRVYELVNIQFFMTLASYLFYFYRYKLFLHKCCQGSNALLNVAYFTVIGCAQIAYLGHYIRTENLQIITLICFLSVAIFIHVMLITVGFVIEEHLAYWILPQKLQHHILMSKSLHTAIAIALAFMFTTYGVISTSSDINVYTIDVQLKRLPQELDKFTIALITDVHIGPTVHKQRVKEIVDVVNKLSVDAVAISGDLVDGFVYNLDDVALELVALKSKHGVFYVTGNHEYYHDDIENWLEFIKNKLKFNVLHNSNKIVRDGLCIAGVDDYHTRRIYLEGHKMDPEKAFKGCPENNTLITLAHQPNAAIQIMKLLPDKTDLILSGHTHNGQMYVTWPLAYLGNSFLHGLYKDSLTETQVFVSAGVNYWGPPVKMRRLCEIPLIRLRADMGNGHEIYLTVWVTVTIVALVTVSNFLFSKIRQQYVSVEGYERGNSLRVVAIFQLISMMAALSLIIYYHLFSFFQYPGTVISFSSKAELRKCNRRCFYVFLFVMFGGHFAYVLYLFDYVPWVIFELFNIFCGFWMHLFFFSFLFFYGNFVTSLLENFPLGQRFLSFLTRPSFMKSIVYDSQVQVATTVFLTLAMSYIQWFASDKLSVHSASFNLTHPLPSPLQVVVLTDIHSGASVYESQVADVVDKVNEMNADVVFLNGDTIDAPVDRIYDRVEPLRHLKSKYGVFMVSGNHEYYYGNWNDWVSHFEGMGITVLQNNVSTVSSVCFVGLNDISSYKSG
ncbi:unnamed protein product [Bursaphelenchus okinawaensis]|uniref:Calcineurin-like phosphoesterase domain-containing protein n=1 Tax=Bursaphelenchus okinawaensis TaxID=465554 RepID=A0A811JT07_9BILA|nr:unnamed protein product [Bursaphelenchus okinawaensis]CAG9082351.1 unnamed protein product [Bursaphelenchus okinawaensis]